MKSLINTSFLRKFDTTEPASLDILVTSRGMKYSILKENPDGVSEYILYSGEEPPAFYRAGLPDTVRKLRIDLDDYMDSEGILNQDVVVHCSREYFSFLVQDDYI